MRKFDTKVQHLKYKVLREVAKQAWADTLQDNLLDIPKIIVPGKIPTMRCCVYKERAILAERVKLAMGGNKQNPNVIEVLDIACDECPMGGYEVTNACRGCLAHRCEDVCKFGAITFDENHVVFVFAGKYNSKKDEFVFAEKFREFYGERFAAYLESRLSVPVVMQNDMPAAMQSALEKTSTPDDFIFLYIDEGVGGGFVFNRKVFSGEHGMAGEFGFFGMNPIDATDFFPDEKSKIFSTELSLKAISDRYIKAAGEKELNYPDAKERFIADCLSGKELAIKTLDESVAVLGRVLWSLTELLDVSNIIFDGEIVRLGALIKARLDEMFLKSPTYSKIDVGFITDANAIYNGAVATGIKTFENYV